MPMKEAITHYYNELAKKYDEDRFSHSYGQYVHRQEDDVLKKYLDEEHIEGNLDLACGTGRFLKYANYGVDISDKMIEIAKAKYPKKNNTLADAENLSFQNSFFSNVISFHLFMHLDESAMRNILAEVYRVLKKGGLFIFDVPSEKRRKLTGYRSSNWHGGHQISSKALKLLVEPRWELLTFHGIAFLPIHRLPDALRKHLVPLDSYMCHSFLKEYSSHLIFILRKK